MIDAAVMASAILPAAVSVLTTISMPDIVFPCVNSSMVLYSMTPGTSGIIATIDMTVVGVRSIRANTSASTQHRNVPAKNASTSGAAQQCGVQPVSCRADKRRSRECMIRRIVAGARRKRDARAIAAPFTSSSVKAFMLHRLYQKHCADGGSYRDRDHKRFYHTSRSRNDVSVYAVTHGVCHCQTRQHGRYAGNYHVADVGAQPYFSQSLPHPL